MEEKKLPSSDEIARELSREQYKKRYKKTLKSTIFALITAAAVAVLIATLWMPVLQIFGTSMTPTLAEGEIVVCTKLDEKNMKPGDIIAFYYGNKVLVKRYIAGPGSWVELQEDGTLIVDGAVQEEPYLPEGQKHLGICDLEMPYQVPEGTYFLIGDMRETSVDSRHSSVGCIAEENIVGKIVYRVWPFKALGTVH